MVKFFIGLFAGVVLTLGVQHFLTKGGKTNEITIDERIIDSLSVDAKREYLEERARARKKGVGKND